MNLRQNPRVIWIFWVAAVFVVGYVTYNFNRTDFFQKDYHLSFVPNRQYQYCEELFVNTSAAQFSMSTAYIYLNNLFKDAIRNASRGQNIEGYSGQLKEETLAMHYIAKQTLVKTVCETGFNLGHSSFNYLTANDELIVHSFDLGNHAYAHEMSKFMSKTFPSRFFIHFGDSTVTIPEFTRANPSFQCDMILVDGGHVYPVALADLKNFANVANLKQNIIIFDDYPTNWGNGFGKAWEDLIQNGTIKELARCTFNAVAGLQRGFVIGTVLRKAF